MSSNQLIAIVAVVVSSTTALLVAYWQRKQARQVEAFRRDPSVGLIPPPSPIWVAFKRHWLLIPTVGFPAAILLQMLRDTQPITRGTIAGIALCISSIIYALLADSIRVLMRVIEAMVNVQGRQIGLTRNLIDGPGTRERDVD